MSRGWKIAGVASMVAALALIVIWRREPIYQGKGINLWLEDMAANGQIYPTVVREIGIDGLPYAVRNLARGDSMWYNKYRELQPRFPRFLRQMLPEPKPNLKPRDVAAVLSLLGSNSIPSAVALLKHSSPSVRKAAANGLVGLRRKFPAANVATPALIHALEDEEREVRFYAVLALKEMGADASNAVPALTKILKAGLDSKTNSSFYFQAATAWALGKIGPSASGALPALRSAIHVPYPDPPGFQNGGVSHLRGQAAVAIWRINSDTETALPVLLREMPEVGEDLKWDWIIALGEMGPRAKSAIWQLKDELSQDKQPVLEYVTNALIKIGPETAKPATP